MYKTFSPLNSHIWGTKSTSIWAIDERHQTTLAHYSDMYFSQILIFSHVTNKIPETSWGGFKVRFYYWVSTPRKVYFMCLFPSISHEGRSQDISCDGPDLMCGWTLPFLPILLEEIKILDVLARIPVEDFTMVMKDWEDCKLIKEISWCGAEHGLDERSVFISQWWEYDARLH